MLTARMNTPLNLLVPLLAGLFFATTVQAGVTYTYDVLGRVVSVTYTGGAPGNQILRKVGLSGLSRAISSICPQK